MAAGPDLSRQMLELGERKNDVGYQLEGHRALGMTLLWRGELRRARERFELGCNAYDPEQHHRHAVIYGNDPGVACLAHGGYVLSVLGHLEQALAHGAKAMACPSPGTSVQRGASPHLLRIYPSY